MRDSFLRHWTWAWDLDQGLTLSTRPVQVCRHAAPSLHGKRRFKGQQLKRGGVDGLDLRRLRTTRRAVGAPVLQAGTVISAGKWEIPKVSSQTESSLASLGAKSRSWSVPAMSRGVNPNCVGPSLPCYWGPLPPQRREKGKSNESERNPTFCFHEIAS